MADYHFNVAQIKRSAGQSAVACAAYRAGEKLHSDFYGEDSDYTHKQGVVLNDILLPSHVPKEYADREFLWNSVEKAEKHPKAQLAYSFDFSLQNEFSMEENLAIAREFIQRNFVDRGMIADYAVHLPERKDGGEPNPHVHVMCPIRPMEQDGTWGAKQHRVYRLDEEGNRIRDADGKFLFDARPTTDWGEPETLEQWRTAWAEINNAHFAEHGLDIRLDNRSFERQGIDLLPTIHEGPNVREMERKGIRTEKGDRNRWIRQINASIRSLSERIKELAAWIRALKEELSVKPEPTVSERILEYYSQRNAKAWSSTAKVKNLKEQAKLLMYLETNGIKTVSDLKSHIDQIHEIGQPLQMQYNGLLNKLKALDDLEKAGERYERTKPIYDEWYGKFFEKSKRKYADEHKKELNSFYANRKKLSGSRYLDTEGHFVPELLERDREKLLWEIEQFSEEHHSVAEEVENLIAIKKALSAVTDSDVQDRGNNPISGQEQKQVDPVQSQQKKSRKRDDYSL